MVRNRSQCNILQTCEQGHYIFIFNLPINFIFLQDAISCIIFYIHMFSVNSDYRTCPQNEIFMF